MTRRDFYGNPLVPGVNLDPVDIGAGIAEARRQGYVLNTNEMTIIQYALQRWARGEEAQADLMMAKEAGINYTSWRMILAAAVAAGQAALKPEPEPEAPAAPSAADWNLRDLMTSLYANIEDPADQHPWLPGSVFKDNPGLREWLIEAIREKVASDARD